jgi:hypothetical protein
VYPNGHLRSETVLMYPKKPNRWENVPCMKGTKL